MHSDPKQAPVTSKKKPKFELEVGAFVQTFKHMVKELAEVSHFVKQQYPEEKKIFNIRISERVRFGDFDERLQQLDEKFFSMVKSVHNDFSYQRK